MQNSSFRAVLLVAVAYVLFTGAHLQAQAKPDPEYIAWTWNVKPKHPDTSLPNVLLQGDSLSRNYFPEVQRRLQGRANVYLMASSYSSGDPRLANDLTMFAQVEQVNFAVVHFNNGMHAPDFSEAQYKAGFAAYLKALHALAPHAAFIWATTTPVKEDLSSGLTNARIDARNVIATEFVRGIVVDDQHALMARHRDLYQDNIHFNTEGANLGGAQAAQLILAALEKAGDK